MSGYMPRHESEQPGASHRRTRPTLSSPPPEGWLHWYLKRPRRRLFDPGRMAQSPAFLAPLFGGAAVIGGLGGIVSGQSGSWLADLAALVGGLITLTLWGLFMARPAMIEPQPSLLADAKSGLLRLRAAWRRRRRRRGKP